MEKQNKRKSSSYKLQCKAVKIKGNKRFSPVSARTDAKAYIAYNGKVYNVSGSFYLKNGTHQVLHQAGEDLTEAFREAPHTEELLERVPVIGKLLNE